MIALGALVLTAGCSAVDGSETRLPEPSFEPSIVLEASGDTISTTDPDGAAVDPATCVGEVGAIVNTGTAPGRWIGEPGYESGVLEPGERVVLVFREAGTVEWRVGPLTLPDDGTDDTAEEADDTAHDDEPVALALDIRDC